MAQVDYVYVHVQRQVLAWKKSRCSRVARLMTLRCPRLPLAKGIVAEIDASLQEGGHALFALSLFIRQQNRARLLAPYTAVGESLSLSDIGSAACTLTLAARLTLS